MYYRGFDQLDFSRKTFKRITRVALDLFVFVIGVLWLQIESYFKSYFIAIQDRKPVPAACTLIYSGNVRSRSQIS